MYNFKLKKEKKLEIYTDMCIERVTLVTSLFSTLNIYIFFLLSWHRNIRDKKL
jgi:hypothetical protein